MKQQNKQFTQMLQCNVSHVSWLCCYFTLVTLLPYCHVSKYEKFMLHSQVALLPFLSKQVWNKQNLRMLHMCVSVTMAWWHRWCICFWNDMQFSGSQTPRVLHCKRTTMNPIYKLFTFSAPATLRSRSRVDLDELFGKLGCPRLGPISGLSMSIRHDLYFVCKAALG